MSQYPLLRSDVMLSEWTVQTRLHERLLFDGYEVVKQPWIIGAGRPDLVARKPRQVLVIEVKVANPLAGVGQVLAYRARWRGPCEPVLACFEDAEIEVLSEVCRCAHVQLWIVDRFGRYRRPEEDS